MYIEYFTKEPKYNYECFYSRKTKFKHGVDISLWDKDDSAEMSVDEFIFPFFAWIIEVYGYNLKRYEILFDRESDRAFVIFKDEEDVAAFKLLWGEQASEWDEEEKCFVKNGIRIESVLKIER